MRHPKWSNINIDRSFPHCPLATTNIEPSEFHNHSKRSVIHDFFSHILECEFYLLELMDCCLIVFHPYRPLLQFLSDLNITKSDDPLSLTAWRIINDSYRYLYHNKTFELTSSFRSDIMLLHPPYMIALAALHMAACHIDRDLTSWFAELSVDLNKILTISKDILKLYEIWNDYKEDESLAEIFNKVRWS